MKAFVEEYKDKIAKVEAYVGKHQMELDHLKASVSIEQKTRQHGEVSDDIRHLVTKIEDLKAQHSHLKGKGV